MVMKRQLKLRKTKRGKSMTGGSACAAAKESNKVMTGGSACAAAKESNKVMTGGSACAAKPAKAEALTGGSLASSFVEDYANVKSQSQPLDEYQTEMGLPGMGNLKGGSCGCASSWMQGGKKSKRKGSKKTRKTKKVARKGWHAKGGSGASERVANAISAVKSDSADYEPASKVSGVHDMPNLYETTGGGADTHGNNKKKVMRGGRFWNFAGCGPANYPDAGRKYAHHFSKTSRCPGPEEIANPPGLGKAGSGDSADLPMGGTYPFA
jgi:hypothetical protein